MKYYNNLPSKDSPSQGINIQRNKELKQAITAEEASW